MYNPQNLKVYLLDAKDSDNINLLFSKFSWFIPDMAIFPTSAQGFVVFDHETARPLMAFHAMPYIKKVKIGALPVLRVARILSLTGSWDEKLSLALIHVLQGLGQGFRVRKIEIEVYETIDAEIFFPSSNCSIDVCNDPSLAQCLRAVGLVPANTILTYGLSLDSIDYTEYQSTNFSVRPIHSKSDIDRQEYYRLWADSGKLPFFCSAGKSRITRWHEERPWYEDYSPINSNDKFVLFAELNGNAQGFVHWWPNNYRMAQKYGRNSIYSSREKIAALQKEIKEAKIFKLAISTTNQKLRRLIERSLLHDAMSCMASNFNISQCQVSGITKKDESLLSTLEDLGGKKVHSILLFEVNK